MSGVNLRDYFAMHAPLDAPEWFAHVEPRKDLPPDPQVEELDETHQQLARDWRRDPCFDLPGDLQWYADKVNAHRDARSAWEVENARARFIQWRWFYADAMLAGRETS